MSSTLLTGQIIVSKIKNKKYLLTGLVAVLLVIAIGARAYLPIWVKDHVNSKLMALDKYDGHVDDIDISLIRGAYKIDGLIIYKSDQSNERPFVKTPLIDLSIEWRSLLRGAIVAEIDIYDIELNFAKSQTGKGAGWKSLIESLAPFDINRASVNNGKISYTDYTSDPHFELSATNIDAEVKNLRAVKDDDKSLPSTLVIAASTMGDGQIKVSGDMNMLKETPDFDMSMEFSNANLTAFNDYAKRNAMIDFQSGVLDVSGELAAADGNVVGYVKPVASNVAVVGLKDDMNPINFVWESLVSVVMEIFENQPNDQIALRIPIEGNLNDIKTDMFSGIISILSNAFGEAFTKQEDGTISFSDAFIEQQ